MKFLTKILKDYFSQRRSNICYLYYSYKQQKFDMFFEKGKRNFELPETDYIKDQVLFLLDRNLITEKLRSRKDKSWHNRLACLSYEVTHDRKVVFDYERLEIKNKK